MSSKAKIALLKQEAKFKFELEKQKLFFGKPVSLVLLTNIAIGIADGYATKLKQKILQTNIDFDIDNDKLLQAYLKKNPSSKALLKYVDNILDEEILSAKIIECENLTDDSASNLSSLNITSEDFLESIKESNDLWDKRINPLTLTFDILTGSLLAYHIIKRIIHLLKDYRFPSKYGIKRVAKLIRVTISAMVDESVDIYSDVKKDTPIKAKNGFVDLVKLLEDLDSILIAISIATALYIYNRSKTQEESMSIVSENICKDLEIPETIIDSSIITDLSIPLNCPISMDNVIVPKQPFENKEDNLSCEIAFDEDEEINAILKPILATKAIIQNNKTEDLIPIIEINSKVTTETIIATLNNHSVYSPVDGYIDTIKSNKITLREISDTSEDFLATNISLLNDKYNELNNIKVFVNNWQVKSLYPIMIANAPNIDNKLTPAEILGLRHYGMDDEFDKIKKDWDKVLEEYNKNIQDITGANNVKTHAENETTHIIKEEVDTEQEIVFKFLKDITTISIETANKTRPKSGEFELIEYYLFELYDGLNKIKEVNDIEKTFRDQINIFTEQRYVIDGFKPKKINDKGNDLLDKLEKGITIGDWFEKGIKKYKERNKLSDVENWLVDIGDKNKRIDQPKREELIGRLMILYKFYLNTSVIGEKYKTLKNEDNKKHAVIEGTYIFNFFEDLNKRFLALNDEIKEIEKIIDDLSLINPYFIITENNEEYRNYIIANDDDKCNRPDIDVNLGGETETDFGSIKYWLKYCALATLASVTNPGTGWSTGLILPSGPVLLPTVYIPIKAIKTDYGFILLGLTITGMWVSPLILFANYSLNYKLPILDPVAILKQEVEAIKSDISDKIKTLKNVSIKQFLDKIEKDVIEKEEEVKSLTKIKNTHRLNKPEKHIKVIPESNSNTSKLEAIITNSTNNATYAQASVEWAEEYTKVTAALLEIKLQKWLLEKIYKEIYKVYTLETSIKKASPELLANPVAGALKAIEITENLILSQLDKLDIMIDNINKVIAPLPITLQPNSVNFGMSIKNPKPLIDIASDIDDTINTGVLDKIVENFRLDNETLMTSKIKIDYKKYLNVIKLALPTLIKKDPFPAYENLSPINIPYVSFLYTSFVPAGAQTYGIPGQLPIPIG